MYNINQKVDTVQLFYFKINNKYIQVYKASL